MNSLQCKLFIKIMKIFTVSTAGLKYWDLSTNKHDLQER
ncbi:hypothetical protein Q667_17555 [Marinobacter sp. C1S70]|nr:hypothetical protein Q667_17555 [Marinobacter sp. C1S70]